jgi:uncharacterized protein (DUF433 family)
MDLRVRYNKFMSLEIIADPVPLRVDASGVVCVGDTRVSLDTVIRAYLEGATAEEIAEQFSTLHLADIYAAITYYLKHRGEVDEYLGRRRQQQEKVRQENEARTDPSGLRERLLARMKSSTPDIDAASGDR